MIDLNLQNYVEWEVTNSFSVRGVYGYRVILKYMDDSAKSQQKSGFATLKLANKAREKAIAELYAGTYIVHNNVKVSELMGHAKEIVTIDVYGDNQGIISEGVPEITEYMEEVLPTISQEDSFKQELLEIVADTSEYIKEVENGSNSE